MKNSNKKKMNTLDAVRLLLKQDFKNHFPTYTKKTNNFSTIPAEKSLQTKTSGRLARNMHE